jgi:hypothetical protein
MQLFFSFFFLNAVGLTGADSFCFCEVDLTFYGIQSKSKVSKNKQKVKILPHPHTGHIVRASTSSYAKFN